MYYLGSEDRNHRRGVGIIVSGEIAKVSNFIPYLDRSMSIKIESKPLNINIIQVYAVLLIKRMKKSIDSMEKSKNY